MFFFLEGLSNIMLPYIIFNSWDVSDIKTASNKLNWEIQS